MRKASRFSYYSSSSSSKWEFDGKPDDAVNSSDRPVPDCMCRMAYSWKSSNLNLPPEAKCWSHDSHPQPNCAHHKDISPEQLNASELEILSAGFVEQIGKFNGVMNAPDKEYGIQPSVKANVSSFLSKPWKVSATCVKDGQDPKIQERKGASNSSHEVPKKKDMGELLFSDDHLVDWDYFNLAPEKPDKLCSDLESHLIEAERTVPWWRTSDKDEWASLVSLKSPEHVENCDLAHSRTESFGRPVSASPQCSYHCKIVESSSDEKAIKEISSSADCKQGSFTSTSMDETRCTAGDVLSHGLDRAFSNIDSSRATSTDKGENPQRPWADLSKTELLEALCHSQTRAREAEKAAQQAYNEKEHIVTLFLRQASCLFAYRQWFQILQLENCFLQLKNKDGPTSIHLPPFLPWVPSKGMQMKKGRHKARKRKPPPPPPPPRNKIRKCAVAFALGLSLAGAGLFLGWTMGWFFPGL